MILSCNSTKASICGLTVSWKYSPQALGASQLILLPLNRDNIVNTKNTGNKNRLIIFILVKILLCNGKLVNA
jgi:hypothetical protein